MKYFMRSLFILISIIKINISPKRTQKQYKLAANITRENPRILSLKNLRIRSLRKPDFISVSQEDGLSGCLMLSASIH